MSEEFDASTESGRKALVKDMDGQLRQFANQLDDRVFHQVWAWMQDDFPGFLGFSEQDQYNLVKTAMPVVYRHVAELY